MSEGAADAETSDGNRGSGTWVVIRKGHHGEGARFFLRRRVDNGTGTADNAAVNAADDRVVSSLRPPARPTDPSSTLSFYEWRARYSYFVQCMLATMRHRFEGAPLVWDWDGLRERLERFVYRTSSSRSRRACVHK